MENKNNFGYFIVPFCVNIDNKENFKKYINDNKLFEKNSNFFECK